MPRKTPEFSFHPMTREVTIKNPDGEDIKVTPPFIDPTYFREIARTCESAEQFAERLRRLRVVTD